MTLRRLSPSAGLRVFRGPEKSSIITDGLISRYTMSDDGSTSTLTDSYNGLDLNLYSGVSYVADSTKGTVAEFDGSEDGYAEASYSDHAIPDVYTLCFWLKTTSGREAWVMRRDSGGGTTANYSLHSNNGSYNGGHYDESDSEWVIKNSNATYDDGVWHFCCVQFDGAGLLRLWIDDTITGELSNAGSPFDRASDSLMVGRDPSGAMFNFSGRMCDLRVYNRFLPKSEVRAIKNGDG